MATEIEAIQQNIIDRLADNGILVSDNKLSIRRLWTWVVATCIHFVEVLFDNHKEEIQSIIDTERVHQPKWYQEKAFQYQHGQALTENGVYDNTGLSDEDISAKKIIKRVAVHERGGKIRIKVVTEVDGEVETLSEAQLAGFTTYMNSIKDAGVKLVISSLPPDDLKIVLDFWYDPLVLKSNGDRVDGTATQQVPEAIQQHLRSLPFNGELSKTRLTDDLQKVSGAKGVELLSVEVRYGDFPYGEVDQKYVPDAGYFLLTSGNLTVNYRAYV